MVAFVVYPAIVASQVQLPSRWWGRKLRTFISEKFKGYTVESMLGKERCKDINVCKELVGSVD